VIGVGNTFLVELSLTDLAGRPRARALLAGVVPSEVNPLVLTPLVINEFAHTATDPKRFATPLTVERAAGIARDCWETREVLRLRETADSVALFLRWLDEFQLGRKRLLDTQLAATLHVGGVRKLLTSNPADFSVFGVFELLVPWRHHSKIFGCAGCCWFSGGLGFGGVVPRN
jgi:hypothetical protein